jgi:hypothetical protein
MQTTSVASNLEGALQSLDYATVMASAIQSVRKGYDNFREKRDNGSITVFDLSIPAFGEWCAIYDHPSTGERSVFGLFMTVRLADNEDIAGDLLGTIENELSATLLALCKRDAFPLPDFRNVWFERDLEKQSITAYVAMSHCKGRV